MLNGGAGNDMHDRRQRHDLFAFTEIGGADRIMDFNRGAGDKVNLAAIDAVAGGADNAFTFIGTGAFTGSAGQLRAYISGSNSSSWPATSTATGSPTSRSRPTC